MALSEASSSLPAPRLAGVSTLSTVVVQALHDTQFGPKDGHDARLAADGTLQGPSLPRASDSRSATLTLL